MFLLSDRIKELRKMQGLTQKQLGEMINVTKVSICGYELGNKTPSLETLTALANALNVEINYLLGEEYFIQDESQEYGINVSREEIDLIYELRKYPKLYKILLQDPKRTIQLIDKKIR